MISSQDIRRQFLKYFKEKGHTLLPSSPVVPHDDPSLLFTNAGMNQFKDVFLGKNVRDYKRATTDQKCIRVGGKHNDLDNVGHTSRHLTFFEMLGNFSFGDYFKEQAIAYAWEVSTKIFQFEEEKIWVTVFRDDDEAFELWKKIVPEKRIVRLDEKDNFWAMGETGPCGPCSELYFDRGQKYGSATSILEDTTGERYLEFWNLVFMQLTKDSSGKMSPLPSKSIDTGSGLERVVSLKMGVESVFATDILSSLCMEVEKISGKKYQNDLAPFHVIADHIRSLSFAIADGAQPSNIERGYVLRKLLRRAVRYGRILGLQDPFLAKLLPSLVSLMGDDFPELKTAQNRIGEIITAEEEAFLKTLKRGGNILNTVVSDALKRPQKEISGEEAFKLKDTYGLPLEEILLIAKDSHLTVNLDAYALLEEQAKEKSKAAHTSSVEEIKENIYQEFLAKNGPCTFVGYTTTELKTEVAAILADGKFVQELQEEKAGFIVLKETPFYAEKGGQVGDTGSINGQFQVVNCTSPYPGIILHQGVCKKGTIKMAAQVTASVDKERRTLIQNNHTATHLLHLALTQILGPHIRQAGSLVDQTHLRFDFNHHKPPSKEELELIEDFVNQKICENTPVQAYELPYDKVQSMPEIKQFFGDKYGATVRVIDMLASKELCGGTHTTATGTIGSFRIVKEGSIAAGVRRIEAVTGKAALEFTRAREKELQSQVEASAAEVKKLHHELKTARRTTLQGLAKSLKAQMVGDIPLIAHIASIEFDELNLLADEIMGLLPSGALLLAVRGHDRCQVVLRLTSDLVKKGLNASQIIKEATPLIQGSGGGRPEGAQAGGKAPDNLDKFFEKVKESLLKS
jgi:alanyl-tRNA synthetase